ncbi:MAG: RsmD family RNA methyltransferase, partial [Mesobacillus sp.]
GKAIHIINENLKSCGLEEKAEVYRNDAVRALKAIQKRELKFDYIFLDPPYKKQQLVKLLEMIDKEGLVHQDGLIVCEHASDINLPDQVGGLVQSRNEKYGIIGITLYKVEAEDEGEV